MKNFRKNKQGLFICEECKKLYKNICGLSHHITRTHKMNLKDYYDKWLKEENEGICKICGKNTKFTGFRRYYKNICSVKCFNKYKQQQIGKSNLKKYGIKYTWQLKIVKEQSKKTKLKKYGDENYNNRKKAKKTCLNKYGVENVSQNINIHNKKFKLKKFRNADIYYQGSYELDFLEKYYDKLDIQRGPSIKYEYKGKKHYYFSDFLIPSKNLVVECKNSYLAKIDKEKIKAKKKATLSRDFNYIMIVDKDYNKFISMI